MTEDHPDPSVLERFMRNEVDAQERRGAVRHLLAGCPRCVAVTREIWNFGEERPRVLAVGQAKTLDERSGDGPDLLRLRYLKARLVEAKLAEARGDWAAAEAAFLESREGFVLEGLGEEAAGALLDLAILYTRQGRSPELRGLARELLPILRIRDIRQGVAAALLFFRHLVETGYATQEALSAVSGYVTGPPREGRPAPR